MNQTIKLVVVAAAFVLTFRCSTNDSGLGPKYDAAAGGRRDAAAGGAAPTGGTIGRGGTQGDGGTVASGGRGGSGGAMGGGGGKGKDAGSGCGKPDAAPGCCAADEHCASGSECVGGDCSAAPVLGVCKATAGLGSGQCWRDSDCASPPGKCQGASVCPCGAACFAADAPGTCAK